MKKIILLLTVIILFSCNQKKEANSKTMESTMNSKSKIESIKNFDWLIGYWKQINEDTESETFENWVKESKGHYVGHGFVMKEKDTLWQEKMNLKYSNSLWVLEVETPGNNDLVRFNLTDYSPTSFTVENPNHDFPKTIKYWQNDNKINALVSGNGKKISFEFKIVE